MLWLYVLAFVLAWQAFWLLAFASIWYRYDVHPVMLKFWYRMRSRLRRFRHRFGMAY